MSGQHGQATGASKRWAKECLASAGVLICAAPRADRPVPHTHTCKASALTPAASPCTAALTLTVV